MSLNDCLTVLLVLYYLSIKKTADHRCHFVRSITDQQVERNQLGGAEYALQTFQSPDHCQLYRRLVPSR